MRSSEWLLYLLLIAGVYIFNLVMQWLARRARRQQDMPPPGEPVPLPASVPDERWGRMPEAAEPLPAPSATMQRRVAPIRLDALAPTRRRISGRLGSRQDLRRAIALMTILGPCRALAPHRSVDSERGT